MSESMTLYTATLLLTNPDVNVPIRATYKSVISQALHVTLSSGRLDIFVARPPETFQETHYVVTQLYLMAAEAAKEDARESVDVRVLLQGIGGFDIGQAKDTCWEVVAVGKEDGKLMPVFISERQVSAYSPALQVLILRMPTRGTGEIVDEEDEIEIGEAGIVSDSEEEGQAKPEDDGHDGEYPVVARTYRLAVYFFY